jgi:hypothetical protein
MHKSFSTIRLAAVAVVLAMPMFPQTTPVSVSSVSGLTTVLPPASACSGKPGLACAIPNLYGPYGLVLPNPTHAAHFLSTFQSDFTALDTAIATQLTLLPLASPASGFTYKYDPATGGLQQVKESFGPVLTERGETIGRHKIFFGATFQRFRFNKLDNVPLHNFPAVFSHQEGTGKSPTGATVDEPFETQFISTQNSIDLKVNQFTLFGTFGITDRIDVSVAVPLLQIGFNVTSNATIERTLGTEPLGFVHGTFVPCCSSGPPFAHFFDPNNPATSITHTFSNGLPPSQITDNLYGDPSKNNAAGIGDVVFRLKGTVYRDERFRLALLTDFRAPTGDEKNFLGSGAVGIKPSLAMSIRTGRLTPHVNAGYQWNGSSSLAGNILDGTKSKLPAFAFFSVGTDIGLGRRLTFAADYLGQELINAPRIETGAPYTVTSGYSLASGQTSFPTISSAGKQTYNQSNAAFGFKYNVFDKLIVSGNLLVSLNDGGLRQRVAPLIGLSYSF